MVFARLMPEEDAVRKLVNDSCPAVSLLSRRIKYQISNGGGVVVTRQLSRLIL